MQAILGFFGAVYIYILGLARTAYSLFNRPLAKPRPNFFYVG